MNTTLTHKPIFDIKSQVLLLPDDATDAQLAEAYRTIESLDSNLNWWRGDLYAHVAKVRPTKRASDSSQLSFDLPVEQNERVQLMMEQSAHPRAVHRMACRVSAVLPPEQRKPGLSWDYHAVVLEECGVFVCGGVDELQGGEVENAHRWLDWVVGERDKGEAVSISDLRQMIRDTRATEEKLQPVSPQLDPTVLGDVLREAQSFTLKMRKVEPATITPHDRDELVRSMAPMIEFYNQLTGQIAGAR